MVEQIEGDFTLAEKLASFFVQKGLMVIFKSKCVLLNVYEILLECNPSRNKQFQIVN